MLPLSYGLEVIHFLEHHKTHGHHHRHYRYHQHHHHHHKVHENNRPLHELSLGDFILKHGCPPVTIEFNGIYMSVKGREEPILKNISGRAKPGQLVAIMGPSGSGKTTLLNALSGRAKIDQGIITLNGVKLRKDHKRQMAYILQQDVFLPNVTLHDTLKFHAEMGLPSSMTHNQKMECMKKVAALFKLDDPALLNTNMGDVTKRGLSGGEIKRANIACELLSNPTVIFVDEPTTGLDSHNACNVVENLWTIARNNGTVIMTIHQPSYKMFQMFDVVLLLCDGEVAFYGKREEVISTLEKLNIEIEAHCNIADILVDQCYTEENRKALIEYARNKPLENNEVVDKGVADTADNKLFEELPMEDMLDGVVINGNSQEGNQLKVNLIVENGTTHHTLAKRPGTKKSNSDSGRSSMFSDSCSLNLEDNFNANKWPISFPSQVRILTKRNFKDSLSKFMSGLTWFQVTVISIVVGGMWFQTPRTEENLYQISGYTFYTSMHWLLHTAFESLTIFSSERIVINKERASGMYRLSSYYCAKMIAELLLVQIYPMLYHIVTKPMTGGLTFASFFALAVMLMLLVLVSQSLGFFISTTIDNHLNITNGIIACSLVSLPSILFGGYFAPNIPWWLYPFQLLSPMFHAYKAMSIVDFHLGAPIKCAAENSIFEVCRSGNATFIPPKYITDVGENAACFFLIHISVLMLYIIVFRVSGYLVLKFFNSPTKTI